MQSAISPAANMSAGKVPSPALAEWRKLDYDSTIGKATPSKSIGRENEANTRHCPHHVRTRREVYVPSYRVRFSNDSGGSRSRVRSARSARAGSYETPRVNRQRKSPQAGQEPEGESWTQVGQNLRRKFHFLSRSGGCQSCLRCLTDSD